MDFDALYAEYFDRIYAYLCCRVGPDAEDVAAQVFRKALAKTAQYDSTRGNVSQWLFGIARNEANYHLRMAILRRVIPLDLLHDAIPSREKPACEILADEQEKKELLSALDTLSSRERDIVTLKFYSMLNNREIAEISGLSESNVGTILYRAMGRLRQALAGGGHETA